MFGFFKWLKRTELHCLCEDGRATRGAQPTREWRRRRDVERQLDAALRSCGALNNRFSLFVFVCLFVFVLEDRLICIFLFHNMFSSNFNEKLNVEFLHFGVDSSYARACDEEDFVRRRRNESRIVRRAQRTSLSQISFFIIFFLVINLKIPISKLHGYYLFFGVKNK